jgi:hypothetical protein
LGDDEMLIKIYIQMKGKENIELELNTDELVDVALGINYAQGFDLYVDPHSMHVDDVASPILSQTSPKGMPETPWAQGGPRSDTRDLWR